MAQKLLISQNALFSAVRSLPYELYYTSVLAAADTVKKNNDTTKPIKFSSYFSSEDAAKNINTFNYVLRIFYDELDALANNKSPNGKERLLNFTRIQDFNVLNDKTEVSKAIITDLDKYIKNYDGQNKKQLRDDLNKDVFTGSKSIKEGVNLSSLDSLANLVYDKIATKVRTTFNIDGDSVAGDEIFKNIMGNNQKVANELKQIEKMLPNKNVVNNILYVINSRIHEVVNSIPKSEKLYAGFIDRLESAVVKKLHAAEDIDFSKDTQFKINSSDLNDVIAEAKDGDKYAKNFNDARKALSNIPEFDNTDFSLASQELDKHFRSTIQLIVSLKKAKVTKPEDMITLLINSFNKKGITSNTFADYLSYLKKSVTGKERETKSAINSSVLVAEDIGPNIENPVKSPLENTESNGTNSDNASNKPKIDDEAQKLINNIDKVYSQKVKATAIETAAENTPHNDAIEMMNKIKELLPLLNLDKDSNIIKTLDLYCRLAVAYCALISFLSQINQVVQNVYGKNEKGDYDPGALNYNNLSYAAIFNIDINKLLSSQDNDKPYSEEYLNEIKQSAEFSKVVDTIIECSKVASEQIPLDVFSLGFDKADKEFNDLINSKLPTEDIYESNRFTGILNNFTAHGIKDDFLRSMYLNFATEVAGTSKWNPLAIFANYVAGTATGRAAYMLGKNLAKGLLYFTINGGASSFYNSLRLLRGLPADLLQSRTITDSEARDVFMLFRYNANLQVAYNELVKLLGIKRERKATVDNARSQKNQRRQANEITSSYILESTSTNNTNALVSEAINIKEPSADTEQHKKETPDVEDTNDALKKVLFGSKGEIINAFFKVSGKNSDWVNNNVAKNIRMNDEPKPLDDIIKSGNYREDGVPIDTGDDDVKLRNGRQLLRQYLSHVYLLFTNRRILSIISKITSFFVKGRTRSHIEILLQSLVKNYKYLEDGADPIEIYLRICAETRNMQGKTARNDVATRYFLEIVKIYTIGQANDASDTEKLKLNMSMALSNMLEFQNKSPSSSSISTNTAQLAAADAK